MSESRALLLIADIGGYTRYMSLHRVGLAHAQANVARLLEAVIDAAPSGLEVVEIEGDAVFFSRPADGASADTARGLYRGDDAVRLKQELEGLGAVETCFIDLAPHAEALPATAERLPQRVGETLSVLGRGVPYLLRPKRAPVPA
jgi:hypothetical protein